MTFHSLMDSDIVEQKIISISLTHILFELQCLRKDMRDLECFLVKYFRKRREEKSDLSKAKSEPKVACTGKYKG